MEYSFWDHAMGLRKQYARMLEPVCREWTLTRNELDVMLFLANNPGFDRAADIVERRGIAKSHVSLAVARLKRDGFLERVSDPQDHRAARLALTEKGRKAARAGQQAQRIFFEALYTGISREERELLRKILCKIMENAAEMEEI